MRRNSPVRSCPIMPLYLYRSPTHIHCRWMGAQTGAPGAVARAFSSVALYDQWPVIEAARSAAPVRSARLKTSMHPQTFCHSLSPQPQTPDYFPHLVHRLHVRLIFPQANYLKHLKHLKPSATSDSKRSLLHSSTSPYPSDESSNPCPGTTPVPLPILVVNVTGR